MRFAVHEQRGLLARDWQELPNTQEPTATAISPCCHLTSPLFSSVCVAFSGERSAVCFRLGFQNQCLQPEMTCLGACSDLAGEKLHSWQKQWKLNCAITWSVPCAVLQRPDVSPAGLPSRRESTGTLSSALWSYWLLHHFWNQVSKIHL